MKIITHDTNGQVITVELSADDVGQAFADVLNTLKGQPNGIASLDPSGKIWPFQVTNNPVSGRMPVLFYTKLDTPQSEVIIPDIDIITAKGFTLDFKLFGDGVNSGWAYIYFNDDVLWDYYRCYSNFVGAMRVPFLTMVSKAGCAGFTNIDLVNGEVLYRTFGVTEAGDNPENLWSDSPSAMRRIATVSNITSIRLVPPAEIGGIFRAGTEIILKARG
jgi:hypothetical protein